MCRALVEGGRRCTRGDGRRAYQRLRAAGSGDALVGRGQQFEDERLVLGVGLRGLGAVGGAETTGGGQEDGGAAFESTEAAVGDGFHSAGEQFGVVGAGVVLAHVAVGKSIGSH